MAFLHDDILDKALQEIEDYGERVDICSTEPTNYTEAVSTYSLGNKTSPTYTGPANGDTSGRKTTIDAVSDGTVTASGTAVAWAVSRTTATTILIAAASLTSAEPVASGNTFTLSGFDIEIPDAT